MVFKAAVASSDHPDPTVIVGGFMPHVFTVPLALAVKHELTGGTLRAWF